MDSKILFVNFEEIKKIENFKIDKYYKAELLALINSQIIKNNLKL